ncbi:LysR family transcriptional regulator [Solimonas marina]|uniref:LysR family transcriptional regulator n=1 Tax=Solimonas marina TaxID=2714601 RepID=A0A969W7I5_9GAMM|nr:LysR family transcriptional regulator [Solimonas marina]NKF22052.1 LysR family transcriptional regulator [Solimonas marina]
MDNRIGEMEVFVQAIERGSFAAAAKALRLTPSAASRTVARIEARLGTRLVERTTRALKLTAEGETYLARARQILADVDDVERSLTAAGAAPRGKLRVSCTVIYGLRYVVPALPAFLAQHPHVVVDLTLSDDVVDLIETRVDVAIRVGRLRDSNLHARQLGRSSVVTVAAPTYLARAGTPRVPADLAHHDCLHFNFRRAYDGWRFRSGRRIVTQAVSGSFLGNSGEALRQMALAGAGIAQLARFDVEDDIRAGRLVSLLEAHDAGEVREIHALYVGHASPSLRVRAFVDFLIEHATIDCTTPVAAKAARAKRR